MQRLYHVRKHDEARQREQPHRPRCRYRSGRIITGYIHCCASTGDSKSDSPSYGRSPELSSVLAASSNLTSQSGQHVGKQFHGQANDV